MSEEKTRKYWCYALNKYFSEMTSPEQIECIENEYLLKIEDGENRDITPLCVIRAEYKNQKVKSNRI